ncbi:uncharacterized protein METZ01_LOCUS386773, partial [marine metagenome]
MNEPIYQPPEKPSLGSSITIKLIVITLLVLGLLILTIPLFFIIDEREERREEVT